MELGEIIHAVCTDLNGTACVHIDSNIFTGILCAQMGVPALFVWPQLCTTATAWIYWSRYVYCDPLRFNLGLRGRTNASLYTFIRLIMAEIGHWRCTMHAAIIATGKYLFVVSGTGRNHILGGGGTRVQNMI